MVYLNIERKEFEKTKVAALRKSREEYGKDSDSYLWENLESSIEVLDFEEGTITIGVDTKLGYVALDIPIDLDLGAKIVEYYLKNLRKVKEALESLNEIK